VLIVGISAGHKIGLGLVGLAFIAFALTSSFLLPRLRPQFPGKGGVAGFTAVTVLFFCAMMSAVWFFGKEPKEAKAGGESPPAATTAPATTAPATTATASTAAATTKAATTAAAPAAPQGDAAAGKQLYAANGCAACHTFKPAGSNGKVGPDLDKLTADAQKANQGTLAAYTAESLKNPGAYVVPGFPNGVMPSFASLGDAKIADLVAFLTKPS
jgi:mono/diheme cytochrome c family protein